MFQFHQNNSQLLFHFIVSPWGAGAFSRDFTKILARQCRAFIRALKIEKLKAPLFPGPGGAGDAIDWCIMEKISFLYYMYFLFLSFVCKQSQKGDKNNSVSSPIDRSKATLLWWFLLFYALGLNFCAFFTLPAFSFFYLS